MTPQTILDEFVIFITIVSLSSCTVGPDFVRPEAPKTEQYTSSGKDPLTTQPAGGIVQRFETGQKVPESWWKLFNSSKLDPIVSKAMEKNQTLQAALASLRQSQQNVMAGEGVFYPQIDANLGASREQSNLASIGVETPTNTFNLFTLSSSVSYALDIFGGNRRAVEALRAQMDGSRYTVQAAYLSLTGNIVNTVIASAAYAAEIAATQEVIRLENEQVFLTRANVKAGTQPDSILLTLQAQLANTEATLPPLRQRQNQTQHLLAVLSGELPSQWSSPAIELADLKLPESLPVSLPSELVRQRPDILQSEAQLHVASAQIGVATAALYPSFTLNGSLGLSSGSVGDLISSNSSFWSFGAGISAPLFQGGTLQSRKQAAVEAFQVALAVYRQTVLTGFQQVADALRALEHDAELVQAQSDALTAAEEAFKLTDANYRAGTANYLQLLVANTQLFQAKIGYFQAVAGRYQDTVALFVALGGPWHTSL